MSSGKVAGRQLVTRPPIVPSAFDKLLPDRFDQFQLFYQDDDDHFRFKLTLVDRSVLPTTKITYSTAVFLIPAGREGEYMFSSKRGLDSILESAACARLIAVSFGRHHVFESQQSVQEELTFVVQILSRQGSFLPTYTKLDNIQDIPFMALDGLGKRHVLAEGESDLSGKYLVEHVEADDKLVRRLYFMDNPFLIQTEVVMKEVGEGVYTVDSSYAAFDYHKAVVAGLLALVESLDNGMLIGLGGGGLINYLHYVAPSCIVTAIELDPAVVYVAERYFGLDDPLLQNMLSIRIGDGLKVGAEEFAVDDGIVVPLASLSFIVIDVDTKDTSVGMSCPPVAFLDAIYLRRLKALLVPSGILAINVSARDPSLLEFACCCVGEIFPTVHLSKQSHEKDINVVLLASQSEKAPSNGLLDGLDATISDDLRLINRDLSLWSKTSPENSKLANDRTKKKKARGSKGKAGKKR